MALSWQITQRASKIASTAANEPLAVPGSPEPSDPAEPSDDRDVDPEQATPINNESAAPVASHVGLERVNGANRIAAVAQAIEMPPAIRRARSKIRDPWRAHGTAIDEMTSRLTDF